MTQLSRLDRDCDVDKIVSVIALGYYTPPLPPGEGPELTGPEYALGRVKEGDGQFGSEELLASLRSDVAASSERRD